MKHLVSRVAFVTCFASFSPCLANSSLHEDSLHQQRHLSLNPSSQESIAWLNQHPNAMKLTASAEPVKLPDSVDGRSNCSAVWDQGDLGSCTGFASKSAMEMLEKKQGNPIVLSALFQYYNERKDQHTLNDDSGASIAEAIIALQRYGICRDKLWDYSNYKTKFRIRPSAKCYSDACLQVDLDAAGVHGHAQLPNNGDDIMAALASQQAVIIGISIYESFMNSVKSSGPLAGIVPVPNTKTEALDGGHALFMVGYQTMVGIDGTAERHYIVKNSWSTDWGDKGYCYIPARIIENPDLTSEIWAISKVGAKTTPEHHSSLFDWIHKHFHF